MVGSAKWEAWNTLKDMPKETAIKNYISELEKVEPEWRNKDLSSEPSAPKSGTGTGGPVFSRMAQEEDKTQESQKDFCYYATTAPISKLEELLRTDPSLVNFVNTEGLTALHYACDRGNAPLAEFLLKNNANVNCRDGEGQTALHYAGITGNKEVVELLLKWKADPNVEDSEGTTPLDLAESEEIKSLLKD